MKNRRCVMALVLVQVGLLAACAAPMPGEGLRPTDSSIVNGEASGAADDAVVRLFAGGGACTATLIAPDLVLTARHCVQPVPGGGKDGAEEDRKKKGSTDKTDKTGTVDKTKDSTKGTVDKAGTVDKTKDSTKGTGEASSGGSKGSGKTGDVDKGAVDACGPFEADVAPSELTVTLGKQNDVEGADRVAARGKELFVSETSDICGHDVALLRLDRKIPNAKVARVRLTAVQKGETNLSTVGFGVTGTDGDDPAERLRRDGLVILGIGGESTSHRRENGQTITVAVPENDLATGESTCNGDSGGPLFDKNQRIIAVTSRGLNVEDNCSDAPAMWAGLAGHAALVRRAATSVGLTIDD